MFRPGHDSLGHWRRASFSKCVYRGTRAERGGLTGPSVGVVWLPYIKSGMFNVCCKHGLKCFPL